MSTGSWQPKRNCFHHSGVSNLGNDTVTGLNAPQVTSYEMIKAMMAYIWPADNEMVRKR